MDGREGLLLDRVSRAPNGCWEWLGSVDKWGYGMTSAFGGRIRTHRLAYRLFCGPLFPGTQTSNTLDRDRKGRGPRGEKNHFATVTADLVRHVRGLLASGQTQIGVARRLGLSRSLVHNIAKGRAWRHLV